MYAVEYIKQRYFFFFYQSKKNMDQNCVDAAIVCDALPQDIEDIEREFEAKTFFCLFPQNHSCATKRIVWAPFQNLGTIKNA